MHTDRRNEVPSTSSAALLADNNDCDVCNKQFVDYDFPKQIGGISVTTSWLERTAECTRVVVGMQLALTHADTTACRSESHLLETSATENQTLPH